MFEKIASGAAAGDAIASTLSDLKAGSELAEDVLSTLVLATTDSKVVAVNSQLEREAARYHLLEPPPMLLSL